MSTNTSTLDTYQSDCTRFLLPQSDTPEYLFPGLVVEAAEFLDKYVKFVRDGGEMNREGMVDELGDVMWFLAMSARHLGVSLDDVCRRSVAKLTRRLNNNTIQGSGDTR